jgi:hypothetical protein
MAVERNKERDDGWKENISARSGVGQGNEPVLEAGL